LLLIVAAVAKMLSLSAFVRWITGFVALDESSALLVAVAIIAIEAVAGLASLWRPRFGAPFAMVLFIVFSFIHVRLLSDPALAACPCFGEFLPSSAATQWGLLAVCVVVIAVQGWLVLAAPPPAKECVMTTQRASLATSLVSILTIIASGLVAASALGYPVPIPECWRINCINNSVNSLAKCYACCVANCPNTALGCQDWCDDRIFVVP